MKYTTIILLCLVLAYLLRTVLVIIFRPARHVHDLLTKHPDAEQTSVFLPSFPISILYFWREPRQICTEIEEMRKLGWTYLRSSRVRDGRLTLRGVTLHFIRTGGFKMSHAAYSPEPTAVGAVSSAVAVHVTSRRWLIYVTQYDTLNH